MGFYKREDADDILNTANEVLDALKEAKKAQEGAQKAIDEARRDTSSAEEILQGVSMNWYKFHSRLYRLNLVLTNIFQITDETEKAQALSNRTLDDVANLNNRLNDLKKKFIQNKKDAGKAGTESDAAERLSKQAGRVSESVTF